MNNSKSNPHPCSSRMDFHWFGRCGKGLYYSEGAVRVAAFTKGDSGNFKREMKKCGIIMPRDTLCSFRALFLSCMDRKLFGGVVTRITLSSTHERTECAKAVIWEYSSSLTVKLIPPQSPLTEGLSPCRASIFIISHGHKWPLIPHKHTN